MKKNYSLFLLIALSIAFSGFSQTSTTLLEQNLKKYISFLADDKLEGRRAGTAGEEKAAKYIADQFKTTGLQPKGTKGFLQAFEINDGREMSPQTALTINGKKLKKGEDFFAFPFSGSGKYSGIGYFSDQSKSNIWFDDLKEITGKNKDNPHFDLNAHISLLANEAAKKGAKTILFYNSSQSEKGLTFESKNKYPSLPIPVFYFDHQKLNPYLKTDRVKVDFNAAIFTKKRTGRNVIGYIDNKAANTVVLGAHYDHLGYGEDGNSMLRTGEKLIHNGADDNASGTATLIELSRLLKSSPAKNNNYLFIAFSAEELGLFGSKYFVENPTINIGNVNYMINMDMVGRLNDSTKTLTIGGIGTSPSWGDVVKSNDFKIKVDSSGTGASDHTSFYRKDIPVLFYFTGLHHDYHKPSDDYDKINYEGAALITQNILQVINSLNNSPKLAFTKTREVQTASTSFKVTLGIMPDYTYSGTGVKADGVTDGRPAAKAGLKAGDVVIGLGNISITDMSTYMKALGSFEKGATTTIKFKRGDEVKEAEVTF